MKRMILLTLCVIGVSSILRAAAGFDAPLEKKQVDLALVPGVGNGRNRISCFYFDQFMVKEIDLGEKGADQLSIIPFSKDSGKPPCQKDPAKNEIVIPGQGPGSWSGYFKGVKSQFVFFDADDGSDGALGFSVFDGRNAKKLFEDAAVGDLVLTNLNGSSTTVRYERAYRGSCSIPKEGQSCWAKIHAEIHVQPSTPPDCATGYSESKTYMAHARCKAQNMLGADCFQKDMQTMSRWDDSPSVIGYPVEIADLNKPTIRPTGMIISCWPAD